MSLILVFLKHPKMGSKRGRPTEKAIVFKVDMRDYLWIAHLLVALWLKDVAKE